MIFSPLGLQIARAALLNLPRYHGMGQMRRMRGGNGALPHFAGYRRQRGRGLMSFLGKAFSAIVKLFKPAARSIAPLVKKAAASKSLRKLGREAAESAISAGIGLASDSLRGENVSSAADKRLDEAKKRIAHTLDEISRGQSKKEKVKKKNVVSTKRAPAKVKAPRSRKRDIFDRMDLDLV